MATRPTRSTSTSSTSQHANRPTEWTDSLPPWIRVWSDLRIGFYPSGERGVGERKVVRGGNTAAEAERRARQIVAEVQAGISLKVAQDSTWRTLCAAWIAQHEGTMLTGTFRTRVSAINSYILPAIGDVRLVETDSTTLDTVIDSYLSGCGGVSRFKTVIQTTRVVTAWARRKKWVVANCFGPESDVKAVIATARSAIIMRDGMVDQDETELTTTDVPSMSDVDALARSVERVVDIRTGVKGSGKRYAQAIYVAAGSGLRMCELLGLKVDDVDLEAGFITVDHQLNRYVSWMPGEPMPTAPPKGRRTRKARAWKSIEGHLRALVETAEPDGTLLPPINGANWWADQWGHILKDAMTDCGWRWAPHYLRHHYGSYSTAPRSKGGKEMDYPTVQKSLGHSSLKTTLGTYIHCTSLDEVGWVS